VVETEKPITLEGLKAAFKEASEGAMKGILGYSDKPLVSMDFKGDSRSSIIDVDSLMVIGDNMAKIVTWYDNEWGYSCRTVDLAVLMAENL
jgi:glyceraldehyde 3-phosphate dehydrogenase